MRMDKGDFWVAIVVSAITILAIGFFIGFSHGVEDKEDTRKICKQYLFGNLEKGESKRLSVDWREFNGGQRVYELTWVE